MSVFKKGDKVRLKNAEDHPIEYRGVLTVDEPELFSPRVGVESVDAVGYHHTGAFFPFELEPYTAAPEFIPGFTRDIRICLGESIGSVKYESPGAALIAAEEHGKRGERFTLVEVKSLGSYRIETWAEEENECF